MNRMIADILCVLGFPASLIPDVQPRSDTPRTSRLSYFALSSLLVFVATVVAWFVPFLLFNVNVFETLPWAYVAMRTIGVLGAVLGGISLVTRERAKILAVVALGLNSLAVL